MRPGTKYERPIASTNADGKYYLSVHSPFLFDSIKTCVIVPNASVIYSSSLVVNSADLWEVTEPYTKPSMGNVGCTTCSVEPEEGIKIVKYDYSLTDVSVNICN